MVIGGALIAGATIAVLGVCVLLVLLVVAVRARRHRRQRREEMLLSPLRPHLIEVAAGEDDEGVAVRQLTGATDASRTVLDRNIVELLTKIRGVPAEQLVEVLEAHGAVEAAARDLTSRSAVRRARAAQLLGLARAGGAVPLLVNALEDEAVEVRNSAAYALGLIGDAAAAGPVLSAIGHPERGLPAATAAEALQSMGVGISEVLREALDDDHPRTRMVAAHLSGERSFTRCLPDLRRLLEEDGDLTVRETCAHAIGRLGRGDDVEVLARHTGAGEPLALRRACVAALGELGQPAAVPALAALLDDPDPRLAELAAAGLLGLGADGREALVGHADDPAVQSAQLVASLQRASA
ncbi:HEAT repeat domain-containing protein [Terrabacter sp. NPDC080008]|uniref:HEAT repeat domain-containing protein n=1 Tax=Terrabacter sp. NPDC080008 TaxID=3155176 RepID=UPI00344E78C2